MVLVLLGLVPAPSSLPFTEDQAFNYVLPASVLVTFVGFAMLLIGIIRWILES